MLAFINTKHMINSIAILILFATEIDTQLHFNILSFNNNRAGNNSLNNDGNSAFSSGSATTASPGSGSLSSAIIGGLTFLLNRTRPSGFYPYNYLYANPYPYYFPPSPYFGYYRALPYQQQNYISYYYPAYYTYRG